jgi:putative peptidoglycan lipid II flippase
MIKKFLNSHVSTSVASAAFLITITGLISRFVGLFRDRLLALNFGAGDVLDVYYAAFRIPDLIYNLLILGALSAAFIPIFTGLVSNKKDSEAWQMADGIIKLAIISIVFFSFLFCLFSPYLMKIITPGFSQEKIDQTVFFTRIMFLSPLLLGISGIFGGILTSYKRFLIYSLAPIFYNLGIVFGILFFVKFWGPIGLAWGVVLGSFLHLLIQYPMVRQLGLKKIKMDLFFLKDKNIRKILRLMIPRTMGIAVNQINLFVMTFFASTLASGSLAIFSLAQNLQSVPLGVIGVSFAIAVFPVLSSLASRNEDDKFIKTFF